MGICKWILLVIHYLIWLKTTLAHLILGFPSKKWLFEAYHKNPADLIKDSQTLSKLPVHVGFLICENDVSCHDLANLCVWCIGMGVSCISLYDANGNIKRNQSLLCSEIMDCQKMSGNQRSQPTIHMGGLGEPDVQKNSSQPSRTNIYILSPKDGRNYLVEVTKSLCEQTLHEKRCAQQLTLSQVQTYIEENQHFPDPDLLVRFGSVDSLLGYLPWQIRLSEILHVPSHLNIDYKTFLRTLQGYANCNQRFGK